MSSHKRQLFQHSNNQPHGWLFGVQSLYLLHTIILSLTVDSNTWTGPEPKKLIVPNYSIQKPFYLDFVFQLFSCCISHLEETFFQYDHAFIHFTCWSIFCFGRGYKTWQTATFVSNMLSQWCWWLNHVTWPQLVCW